LYEAGLGFRSARVIDPSGGWEKIGGAEGPYGPFLAMPTVGVADLDGNGCAELVFVHSPVYNNQIGAWDECRNVYTYLSGDRSEPWVAIAAGDLDATFVEEETLDQGVTLIPKVAYAVLHDPSGSGSYSYLKESTSNVLAAQFSLSVGVGVSVEAQAEAFGSGVGARAGVKMTATVTEGMEITYTTTDEVRSSQSGDRDHIGPGFGDVFWGEAWEVHWELRQRTVHSGGTTTVEPVYRYSVVRLSKFVVDAFWVKQNMATDDLRPWRDFLLGFDVGADNLRPSADRAEFLENQFFITGVEWKHDVTVTSTTSVSVEFKVEIEASAYAKLGFDFGVVKASGKVEITLELTMGAKVSASHTTGRSVGYRLYDDASSDPLDRVDEISLAIYGDKTFGTYHFLTNTDTSYTSLPHEHWTQRADATPPTIGSVTVVPHVLDAGDVATIRVPISDLSGVSRAEARIFASHGTAPLRTEPMYPLGGTTFEGLLDTTGLDGMFTISIFAEDEEGNEVVAENRAAFVVTGDGSGRGAKTRTALDFTAGVSKTVDCRPDVHASMAITTRSDVSDASLSCGEFSASQGPNPAQPSLGIFIELVASANLEAAVQSITIHVYYRDADVPPGTEESDIRLYVWDRSGAQWVLLSSSVDTVNNVVSATTGQFSVFGPLGNYFPVADAGFDKTAQEGSIVSFTALAEDGNGDRHGAPESFDRDGTIVRFEWDFGDGSPRALGPVVSHAYADNGIYQVTLLVEDNLGRKGSDAATVTVLNVPPRVAAGPDVSLDEAWSLGRAASFSDPGFDLEVAHSREDFNATVDWGDGIHEAGGVIETPGRPGVPTRGFALGSHVYGDNGVFTVTISVCDDDGGCGTDSFAVSVNNLAPSLKIVSVELLPVPLSGESSGTTIKFTGSAIDMGSDDLTLEWSWGDGTHTRGRTHFNNGRSPDPFPSPGGTFPFRVTDTVYHTYARPGTYVVTLIAWDDDGGVSWTRRVIEVVAPPPPPDPPDTLGDAAPVGPRSAVANRA